MVAMADRVSVLHKNINQVSFSKPEVPSGFPDLLHFGAWQAQAGVTYTKGLSSDYVLGEFIRENGSTHFP